MESLSVIGCLIAHLDLLTLPISVVDVHFSILKLLCRLLRLLIKAIPSSSFLGAICGEEVYEGNCKALERVMVII